jgi:hypothetical protein
VNDYSCLLSFSSNNNNNKIIIIVIIIIFSKLFSRNLHGLKFLFLCRNLPRKRPQVDIQSLHLQLDASICSPELIQQGVPDNASAATNDSVAVSTATLLPALSAGQQSAALQQYLVQPVAESNIDSATSNSLESEAGVVLESVLTNLLQETLKELHQQSSPSQLASEPVPYYENQRPSSPLPLFMQKRYDKDRENFDHADNYLSNSEPISSLFSLSSTSDMQLDQETLAVLCSPAFSSLGNFLLESSMQNLISEALHGDFDPESPPRQIVSGSSLIVEDIQALAAAAASKKAEENIARLQQYQEKESVGIAAATWKTQQLFSNEYFVNMHLNNAPEVLKSTVAPEHVPAKGSNGAAVKRS